MDVRERQELKQQFNKNYQEKVLPKLVETLDLNKHTSNVLNFTFIFTWKSTRIVLEDIRFNKKHYVDSG